MSPDPYKASAGPSDPGSWNRYSYVQGDPVNYTDRTGLNRDAEDCIDDPDACEAEDWGGMGGSGPINPGSEPTLPAKVLNEENQLEGLQQAGIINGWGITPTGFELTLTQGEAAGIGICLTDPVCVAIGGGLIAIYATYTYGPDLIQAIENVFQMSRTTSRDYAPPYKAYNTGKNANGMCNEAGPKVKWPGSDPSYWHYIVWNVNPQTCWAIPTFATGPDPGPDYINIGRAPLGGRTNLPGQR